jgi:hypothetical protein
VSYLDKKGLSLFAQSLYTKIKSESITSGGKVEGELNVNDLFYVTDIVNFKGVTKFNHTTNLSLAGFYNYKDLTDTRGFYINTTDGKLRICKSSINFDNYGVHDGIEEVATFDYASGTDNGFFRINRHVNAFSNDYYLLGSPSFRWKTIYSINALSTSSSTYKDNIKYLDGMKYLIYSQI